MARRPSAPPLSPDASPPPAAKTLPTSGGSWVRDPRTGELTRAEEPTQMPADAPAEPTEG